MFDLFGYGHFADPHQILRDLNDRIEERLKHQEFIDRLPPKKKVKARYRSK